MINFSNFFNIIKHSLFSGKLTQGVVDTCNQIMFDFINTNGIKDKSDVYKLSYILATAYHESYHKTKNPEWLPVREGFAKTNKGAIDAVTSLFNKGRIKTNYALPESNGHSYYGRGFVQITWPDNYKKAGKKLNLPLYTNPDMVLDRKVSSLILIKGSLEGWFRTGKDKKPETLDKYLNTGSPVVDDQDSAPGTDKQGEATLPTVVHKDNSKKDYLNARNVINGGLDKASLIKTYAEKFENALINSLVKSF